MTASHRLYVVLITIVLVFVLSSCVASRSQQPFAMSFLPAPIPSASETSSPPEPAASLYATSMPNLAQRTLPKIDWPSEADSVILKADRAMEQGRKLYQSGDRDGARKQFNAAIDTLLEAPENMASRQKLDRKIDQLVDMIYRYDQEGLGAGDNGDKVVYDRSPMDGMLEMTFPSDPRLKPKVMEEIKATASQLPLELNDSVLSYINYFSSDRGRKTLIAGLRRSGKYQPMIRRILQEEGVPQELIYLAQAESGFLPRAVSYKQAEGMWQFVEFRGRQYGLMQTSATDDRLDPEKATRAAARHLHDLYNHFGDWYLAMAAYNCGPGCVDKAVERTGFADFWELRSRDALPRQTENYVPLILAITIMAKNPKDYGLEGLDLDQPLEYDSVKLTAATNTALVADALDRPVSEIREYNPELLRSIAPAGYELHVPQGTADALQSALENVPAGHRATWRLHRMIAGETLAQVAKEFQTSANSIAAANGGLSAAPEAGDLVVVPTAYNPDARVARRYASSKRLIAHSRTSSHRGRRTVARSVPPRILHHRAAVKTARTASLRGPRSTD